MSGSGAAREPQVEVRYSAASPARRWPDLMMGALILALLGGFGLLLNASRQGVSRPPTASGAPGNLTIPSSPGTVPETTTAGPLTSTGPVSTNRPITAPSTTPAPPPVSRTSAPSVPKATTPSKGLTQEEVAAQTGRDTYRSTPSQNPGGAQPSSGGAVPVSANRVPLRSDYRIMLGSFNSSSTLRGSTGAVAGLGYTVHSINVGDQLVAQVGPFADEASARQALNDIQRVYSGAAVYAPRQAAIAPAPKPLPSEPVARPTEAAPPPAASPVQNAAPSTVPAATPSTPAADSKPAADVSSAVRTNSDRSVATPSSTEPATRTNESAAPTPASSAPTEATYLQVGSFEQDSSAQQMVVQLRAAGFAPIVNAPEGGSVKVVVGPYSGEALLKAEQRLDAAGIQHFRFK